MTPYFVLAKTLLEESEIILSVECVVDVRKAIDVNWLGVWKINIVYVCGSDGIILDEKENKFLLNFCHVSKYNTLKL